MESEERESLEIRRYATFLLRWLWLIVLAAVLAAGVAFFASRRSVPIYEATTTLLINEGQKATGLDYNSVLLSERLAKTYAEMLKRRPNLRAAGVRLGLSWSERDLAELAKQVSVELVRDTQLIVVRVRHPDPKLAADVANTLPLIFIEENEKARVARLSRTEESLSRELQSLQAEIEVTQQGLEAERAKPAPDAAELARRESLLAQYRWRYTDLLREEVRLGEVRGTDSVLVVEPAQVPLDPVLPRTQTNTLLGGAVGAMLAVGIVLLFEYLDDTIKGPEDVSRVAGLPTFASVGRFQSAPEGQAPLAAVNPNSAVAEAYRVLRTNLQVSTLGIENSAATLLVTSSQPLEGKSTTLANLGVSLAQSGKRVLLVDTDLRRPTLHRRFGLPNEAGLTTLLLGRGGDLNRVIRKTDVKKLRVLTAGPIPANPAELLAFPRTAALLERLKTLADYVILDSPPVLSAADASILAQKVDGVILVAEMGRVRAEMFGQAVLALQWVKARLLGVVISKVRTRPSSYYYDSRPSDEAAGEASAARRKGRLRVAQSVASLRAAMSRPWAKGALPRLMRRSGRS